GCLSCEEHPTRGLGAERGRKGLEAVVGGMAPGALVCRRRAAGSQGGDAVEALDAIEIVRDLVEVGKDPLLEEDGELRVRIVARLPVRAVEAQVPRVHLDLPDAQRGADGRILLLDRLADLAETLGRDVLPDPADVVEAREIAV